MLLLWVGSYDVEIMKYLYFWKQIKALFRYYLLYFILILDNELIERIFQ